MPIQGLDNLIQLNSPCAVHITEAKNGFIVYITGSKNHDLNGTFICDSLAHACSFVTAAYKVPTNV